MPQTRHYIERGRILENFKENFTDSNEFMKLYGLHCCEFIGAEFFSKNWFVPGAFFSEHPYQLKDAISILWFVLIVLIHWQRVLRYCFIAIIESKFCLIERLHKGKAQRIHFLKHFIWIVMKNRIFDLSFTQILECVGRKLKKRFAKAQRIIFLQRFIWIVMKNRIFELSDAQILKCIGQKLK